LLEKEQSKIKDRNAASLVHGVSNSIPPQNFQNESSNRNSQWYCSHFINPELCRFSLQQQMRDQKNAVPWAAHHCGIARWYCAAEKFHRALKGIVGLMCDGGTIESFILGRSVSR